MTLTSYRNFDDSITAVEWFFLLYNLKFRGLNQLRKKIIKVSL